LPLRSRRREAGTAAKRRPVAIGLALVLVLGAAGLLASGLGGSGAGPLYHTAPVERGDLTTTITASGTLRPLVTVDVGSQLSGQIAELLADFNDQVKQGQPIARLDARTFEAKVREERAAVEVARATVLIEEAAVEKAAATLANTKVIFKTMGTFIFKLRLNE
jgi:HlyD family secretion protein